MTGLDTMVGKGGGGGHGGGGHGGGRGGFRGRGFGGPWGWGGGWGWPYYDYVDDFYPDPYAGFPEDPEHLRLRMMQARNAAAVQAMSSAAPAPGVHGLDVLGAVTADQPRPLVQLGIAAGVIAGATGLLYVLAGAAARRR